MTIASILMNVLGMPTPWAQAYLRSHPARFIHDGLIHRIDHFDPGPATWVCTCGLSFEGDAHNESANPGGTACLLALADEE